MATMKSAKAEKATAVNAAEKMATIKSVVGTVAHEKATAKTSKTIVSKCAERNALSKGIRPRVSVGVAWETRAEYDYMQRVIFHHFPIFHFHSSTRHVF